MLVMCDVVPIIARQPNEPTAEPTIDPVAEPSVDPDAQTGFESDALGTVESIPDRRHRGDQRHRGDLIAVRIGIALVAVTAGVGWWFRPAVIGPATWWPPLFAKWLPHFGPGTIPAVLVVILVVGFGPSLAIRLGWKPLLSLAFVSSFAWTFSLALIDGWRGGIADRLHAPAEYLTDLPRIGGISSFLSTFTDGIVDYTPASWTIQVAGHPPGATLIFVSLDRIGLSGGGVAGMLCIVVGASACAAVAITIRTLGQEKHARAALPYLVLFPGAVWIGTTGDGLFTGIIAWGIAVFAVGTVRRDRFGDVAALGGGLILGFGLYLSYGFVLVGLFPIVLAWRAGRLRPLIFGAIAVAAVVLAFTAAGFWWWEGYDLVKVRYVQGVASLRTYGYWLWGNLACLAFVIGPAALAAFHRVARRDAWPASASRPRRATGWWRTISGYVGRIGPVPLLAGTAVVVMVVANLSGLSKSEVERIWLPFAIWAMAACALLPTRHARRWLAAQGALALLANSLLWMGS